MTLHDYLTDSGMTETAFAETVGATQSTINRLRKGQVPGKELMAKIFEATDGKVRADDFFGLGRAA